MNSADNFVNEINNDRFIKINQNKDNVSCGFLIF